MEKVGNATEPAMAPATVEINLRRGLGAADDGEKTEELVFLCDSDDRGMDAFFIDFWLMFRGSRKKRKAGFASLESIRAKGMAGQGLLIGNSMVPIRFAG